MTPGHEHIVAEGAEAADERRDRVGLPRTVDDEDDREAEQRSQIGGRAGTVGSPVEKAHHRFDDQHPPAIELLKRGIGPDEIGPHRPGIVVQAGFAARRRMKGRIDVVGPGLAGRDARRRAPSARAAGPA